MDSFSGESGRQYTRSAISSPQEYPNSPCRVTASHNLFPHSRLRGRLEFQRFVTFVSEQATGSTIQVPVTNRPWPDSRGGLKSV